MVLTTTYIASALLLAPVILVASEWIGHDRSAPPPHRVTYSVLAAALWPLLVVGLAQFAVIVAVRHVLVSRPSGSGSTAGEPFGDEADTAKLARLAVPYVRVQVGTPAI